MAQAAAAKAAQLIAAATEDHGRARILVSTGNSQVDFIAALVNETRIDWSRVEVFHLDEYVGMSDTHPASFRRWIRTRLADRVDPYRTNYLAGDAPDIEAELIRYSALLGESPIDVAFVGIGENGHIAFNDPHVADFQRPESCQKGRTR